MRALQTDPYSPATQPYSQAKPFIATPGFGQPMQQQPPLQQHANGIKTASSNPFDFGVISTNVQHQLPQQAQEEPAKETQSPIPSYVSFQTGVQPTGNDAFSSLSVATSQPYAGQGGAMTLQNFSGAASAETAPRGPPVVPEKQVAQGTAVSQGAPVTPSPQYGKPGAAIQSSNAGQMQTFHPSTPTQQYNAPFASNFGVRMPSGLPPQAPSTPQPTGIQIQNNAIGSSDVVSPHRGIEGSSPSGQTDFDDFFSGPPMGTPTGGANGLGVSSFAMVSNSSSPGNQYEGIIDGMGNLSVGQPIQLALPSEGHRPYQNYSTSYPPRMGNQEVQTPFQQQSHVVQLMASKGPGGQQQQMNQSPTNWSYGTHPSPSSPWDATSYQQRQPYSPEQVQGQIQQIPRLNHSPRGAATGDASGCSALNQAEPYGPHSRYYDPMDVKPYNAIDDHKNSADVIRERGAGVRALRLLDETTTGGYTSEVVSEYKVKSLRQAVKEERVRGQTAKQIRKMKALEYKSREKMAESSRQANTPRHCDPELTEDKSLLDFDRQRQAQKKALKLMRMF